MEERQEPVTREDPLKRQLEHFCALIRGEENEPRVSVYDGLQNLLVIDAIIKATETEAYVSVQDVTALVD